MRSQVSVGVCAALAGFCGSLVAHGELQQDKQEVLIRDAAGKPRIRLGAVGNGEFGLELLNSEGVAQCRITTQEDGDASVILRNAAGEERAGLLVSNLGRAHVGLFEGDSSRAGFLVNEKGQVELAIRDADGRKALAATCSSSGDAVDFVLRDPSTKARSPGMVVARVDRGKGAIVGILDGEGEGKRVVLEASPEVSSVSVHDDETIRATMFASRDGSLAIMKLLDRAAQTIAALYAKVEGETALLMRGKGKARTYFGVGNDDESILKMKDKEGKLSVTLPSR